MRVGRTCGTPSGYKGHIRLGQRPCEACRLANNEYVRERQKQPEVAERARVRRRAKSEARRVARLAAKPSDLERLMERVAQMSNGCWLWTGGACQKNGYGRAWFQGRTRTAHIAVYLAAGRPAPADGEELDHVCHSLDLSCRGGPTCPHRRCVNPDHLEPVSPLENQRRAAARVTHCPRNHEYTAANTRLKGNMRHCRACARERARAARRAA